MKDLMLADCVNLTDISLKIIGNSCSNLCEIDLSKLHRLTDSGIRCLANGCRSIQVLKLSGIDFRMHQLPKRASNKSMENAMVTISEDRSSKNLPPLTAEEMSVAVLKPRSGIVKGLGIRPSSSVKTTCTSGPNEEVARLKMEIEQQRLSMEQRMEEERNKMLKDMEERLEQQRLENAGLKAMMMDFMKNMGHNGRHPPPDDGSAGLGFGVCT